MSLRLQPASVRCFDMSSMLILMLRFILTDMVDGKAVAGSKRGAVPDSNEGPSKRPRKEEPSLSEEPLASAANLTPSQIDVVLRTVGSGLSPPPNWTSDHDQYLRAIVVKVVGDLKEQYINACDQVLTHFR